MRKSNSKNDYNDRRFSKHELRRKTFHEKAGSIWELLSDNNRAYRFLRDLLHGCEENGLPGYMPSLLEDASYGGISGKVDFNLYPCNDQGKWFPDFVGICYGSERIGKVMDEAAEHQKPVNNIYSDLFRTRSSVTIITDKWNREDFLKYEEIFLDSAANNCEINIILITDYGFFSIWHCNNSMVCSFDASTPPIPSEWMNW